MATVSSNAGKLLADLKALVDTFGFDATVEGATLGKDVVGLAADMIAARSLDREAGADGQWTPNAPDYRDWKAKRYGVDKPNVRTGQMLSIESLIGHTVITTREIQMIYGTGQPPSRSATGQGFDSRTDGAITDIEKAYFCSTSRPFYELDQEIIDGVFARIEGHLEQYLKSNW